VNQIPTDKAAHDKIVQRTQLRMLRSASWGDYQRRSWVRYYKRYRQIKDAVYDADEPNIALSYVFGLVEQINAKVSEPILRMQPPCEPIPKQMGDMKAAKNFESVARDWYAKPGMQEPFCRSKKEMTICGPRWEIDEWQNIERPGRIWGQVPKEVVVPQMDTRGQPLLGKDGKPVMAKTVVLVPGEVRRQVKLHYGFHTRYPSVFNIYPEPDRRTIGEGLPTDCSWIIEDMGEMALEDLIREKYFDPHDGLTKPVYDIMPMLHQYGRRAEERYAKLMAGAPGIDDNYGPLIRPSKGWTYASDYGREDKETVYPTETTVDRGAYEDRDKVWVCRGYQGDELVTIFNGLWVAQRIVDPWHVPVMPARIESLTIDPEFIYGVGAIKPIEDELDELNDIHNLSMSQFIRMVNKLMVIAEGRIVTMNDFKPRAGGKVRVTGDGDVRAAAAEIPQESATNEMLALESDVKGFIEFASSNMDGSPGVRGTKQDHKTLGGLEIIQSNMSPRYTTIQRQGLINEARRMESMERFMSQFGFEKVDYALVNDDGSHAYAVFNKDDIATEGRGFRYAILIDPNYGDTNAQRQLAVGVFDKAVEYEKLRLEFKDPTMRRCDLSFLFEQVLKRTGYRDTSGIFTQADRQVSPDDELQTLMQRRRRRVQR
jgi:hypothetical protein